MTTKGHVIGFAIVLALWLVLCLTGCSSPQKALKDTPAYFRANIGQFKVTLNPLLAGYVKSGDAEGVIYISPLATGREIRHEAFHSFEIRAGYNRQAEWGRFYNSFRCEGGGGEKKYMGKPLLLARFAVWMPSRLYGKVNHFEDAAESFCRGDSDAVTRFTEGKFSHGLTRINPDEE